MPGAPSLRVLCARVGSARAPRKAAPPARNRNLRKKKQQREKKKSQSPPPGVCANCPPPTSRPAEQPVLPAPVARSSRSPESGNSDSPAATAVWRHAHLCPRPRSRCRYSARQFPRREPPRRAPVRAPEIAAPAPPHPPGWRGIQNFLCRSEPHSYTKRVEAAAELPGDCAPIPQCTASRLRWRGAQ